MSIDASEGTVFSEILTNHEYFIRFPLKLASEGDSYNLVCDLYSVKPVIKKTPSRDEPVDLKNQ